MRARRRNPILPLEDYSVEGRVEPIIDMLVEVANETMQHMFVGRGIELYQDQFQADMHNGTIPWGRLLRAAGEISPWIKELPAATPASEELLELLRDPGLFDIHVDRGKLRNRPGTVEHIDVHYVADEIRFRDFSPDVREAFASLKTEEDRKALVEIAEQASPRIQISPPSVEHAVAKAHRPLVEAYLYFNIYVGAHVSWSYNPHALDAAIAHYQQHPPKAHGPEDDDIVYKFKDGFYVANLGVEDLALEGKRQGICVGSPDMGYMEEVREGELAIFSLRTPSGKPKLTFAAELWDGKSAAPPLYWHKLYKMIGRDEYREALALLHKHGWVEKSGLDEDVMMDRLEAFHVVKNFPEDATVLDRVVGITQIKGKANRLPGFDIGNLSELTKADEVEKAVEFVGSLGVHPQDIRDLKPGYEALDDWKIKQEAKRQKQKADKAARRARRNPRSIPVSKSLQRQAQAAFDEPFGGEW